MMQCEDSEFFTKPKQTTHKTRATRASSGADTCARTSFGGSGQSRAGNDHEQSTSRGGLDDEDDFSEESPLRPLLFANVMKVDAHGLGRQANYKAHSGARDYISEAPTPTSTKPG